MRYHYSGACGQITTTQGFVIKTHIAKELADKWGRDADYYARNKEITLACVYRELASDMVQALADQAEALQMRTLKVVR